MKKVCPLLLALLIPLFFYSQEDTCQYKVNEINKILKAKVIKTDQILLAKDKASRLYFSLNRTGNQKYVIFNFDKDLGCTSSDSSNKSFVKMLLENGDIVKFNHFGDTICEDFILQSRLTKSDIKKLERSRVKSIMLSGTKDYQDIYNVEYSDAFLRRLSCID